MRYAWVVVAVFAVTGTAPGQATRPSLEQELAALKVPPAWFDPVQVHWDINKPWKDGRMEVRRLLALNGESVKEGVKITWLYAQKADIGDGHELPMYLFLSGNYAWATVEYEKRMKAGKGKEYLPLASCYMHFGEYEKAKAVLARAEKDLPADPWRINGLANVHNAWGDLYRELGDEAQAKAHYQEAMRLYPTSNQPYGRHLLKRQAAKVQGKLDLMTMQSLAAAALKDGTYKGTSVGYNDQKEPPPGHRPRPSHVRAAAVVLLQ